MNVANNTIALCFLILGSMTCFEYCEQSIKDSRLKECKTQYLINLIKEDEHIRVLHHKYNTSDTSQISFNLIYRPCEDEPYNIFIKDRSGELLLHETGQSEIGIYNDLDTAIEQGYDILKSKNK